MKIRLWGTEDECQAAAERLMRTPGLAVVSVSPPRADRGASVLVRVYVEARLDPPPEPVNGTAGPARQPGQPARARAVTKSRHRPALPPGGDR